MREPTKHFKRILSSILAVSFLAGPLMQLTVLAEQPSSTEPFSVGYSQPLDTMQGDLGASSPVKAAAYQNLTRFEDTNKWEDISNIIGQYYGEWDNDNYSGAYSSHVPNTALLGNGDVGITSAGGREEKTFLISKSDFWSGGDLKGIFNSNDNATKPIAIGGVTISKPTPVTDNPNLAPNYKTVTSSGHHENFAPRLAVNDNMQIDPNGYGWVTPVGRTHWLELSFEAPITVAKWVVKGDGAVRSGHSNNNPSIFKLQTSDTGGVGGVWTDVAVVDNNTEDVFVGELAQSATSAHFRLYITEPLQQGNTDPSPRARIGQFELYANVLTPVPSSKNLALSKPIKVCEVYSKDGSEAEDLVDGNQSSKWCTVEDHQSPHWAIIDLGERKKISSYVMYNASTIGEPVSRNTKDFSLQYLESEDGVAWDSIDQETEWVDMDAVSGNNEAILVRNLDTPVTARYVRLWVTKASAEGGKEHVLRIHELQLFSEAYTNHFYEKQDILNAQILTEMQIDGAELVMETVMSAAENLMITKVTSSASEPVDLEVKTWAKADNTNFPVTEQLEGDGVLVTRSTFNNTADNPKSWTSRVALATKIIGTTSEAQVIDGSGSGTLAFTLNAGQTAYVVTAIGGGGQNYNYEDILVGENPRDVAMGLLAQTTNEGAVETALADHANWWKEYWSASYIDLEGYEAIEKYYYGAQYLLGSTAREGYLAPGLYGIWHTNDSPSWASDYHLNYNFIATFYGANSSNRSALTLPAGEAMLSFVPEGMRRASDVEQLKRINSSYVTGRTDLHGGIEDAVLYPVGIGPWGLVTDDGYHNEALNASYSSYPLIQYYLYTMDEEYLDEKVYDYLKKCAAFYEAWLEEEDGTYTLYAGYNEGSWATNPAVELAALKNVLSTLIKVSETLGRDEDKRIQWQEIYDNLAPQPTSTWNGKTVYSLAEKEWRGGAWVDLANPVPYDGNIIPLDIIIPGGQLGYYSSDAELEIARNTIDVFGNNAWKQINNFPRIFTDAIRSRYPAQTILEMMTVTINSQMAPNLRINDGVHGVEKIGATEAINSMLITSDKDVLKVFPNWPSDKSATFSQLRGVGAFVVSSKYNAVSEEIEYVKITSEVGQPLTMALPWPEGAKVVTLDGEIVPTIGGTAPNWEEEATISFDTTAGETYILLKQLPEVSYTITVAGGTSDKQTAIAGETVSITANAPNIGMVFEKWTATTAVGFSNLASPTTTFIMPEANVEITANFIEIPEDEYLITIIGGYASANSSIAGETVTITATPPERKEFKEWNSDDVQVRDNASAITTFVMPSNDITITAIFTDKEEPINLYNFEVKAGTGGSIVDGENGKFEAGERIAVSAVPDKNYRFDGWISSGGGKFENSASLSTVYIMPSNDTIITATFSEKDEPKNLFDFEIKAGTGGSIVDGENGKFEAGERIVVTAVPDKNYAFDGWISSGGGKFENPASLSTTFIMPGNSTIITAQFTFVGNDGGIIVEEGGSKESRTSSRGGSSKADVSPNGVALGSKTIVNPVDVTNKQVTGATTSAVQSAKAAGATTATVRLKNAGNISLNDLKQMTSLAGMPVKLQADSASADGKNVAIRIALDPSKGTKNINLFASCTSTETNAIKAKFAKWFRNEIQIVSFSEEIDFGQSVEVAVKLDKALLSKELYLYSYNAASNRYEQIKNAGAWVDKNGYLHFNTTLAGTIIISDGVLTKK